MAITIDATLSSATANSYQTLAEAQAIIDGLVEDDDVVAWSSATTDQKNRALFTAAVRINRERFIGAKAKQNQKMQWPRVGVRKPDTFTSTYVSGFPYRLTADYYTETEIPDEVKEAQAILATYLNNNKDGLGLSGLEDFKNVKIGSLQAEPNFFGAVGADRVPPLFERLFTGLRISGPANVSIKRS
ncbi:MAG: hypothetical protein Unbinned1007contig1000_37 [Prokaryotic dsDNA virus sp.]|nr:MAG: hypothetical protein Unbinned1007contig1000_37 [Prokaryotic dsDNA virus sp.]|tara:strand:+ start:3211 stop:3771 length:561 start_codon:yes stop_codon:yes gene_type:complete